MILNWLTTRKHFPFTWPFLQPNFLFFVKLSISLFSNKKWMKKRNVIFILYNITHIIMPVTFEQHFFFPLRATYLIWFLLLTGTRSTLPNFGLFRTLWNLFFHISITLLPPQSLSILSTLFVYLMLTLPWLYKRVLKKIHVT
jgi:hypothetical protein